MKEPKLKLPIVLVHGLLGFDAIRLGQVKIGYFRDIREALVKEGNTVPEPPRLSPSRSVKDRAEELKEYLQKKAPAKQVHIIAHSLGGLDARYMISCLDMAPHVATLTTIATPHLGTPFADWGVDQYDAVLKLFSAMVPKEVGAFEDLTTARCRERNKKMRDAKGVSYFSVAGVCKPERWQPLWFSHDKVFQAEGPNDGLVSVKSATYGVNLPTWKGDHFSLVNWHTNPIAGISNDLLKARIKDYKALVSALAEKGH